jgi:CBS domain-containing protein
MAKLARDIMTTNPACCRPNTPLDQVAKMMVHHDCGEIPVVDASGCVIGVVTDRDIVCRAVAHGMNPQRFTAETCMTKRVVTLREDAPLEEIIAAMEQHQIRRVPVVRDGGACAGIISQADLARMAQEHQVAELVCEVSRDNRRSNLGQIVI